MNKPHSQQPFWRKNSRVTTGVRSDTDSGSVSFRSNTIKILVLCMLAHWKSSATLIINFINYTCVYLQFHDNMAAKKKVLLFMDNNKIHNLIHISVNVNRYFNYLFDLFCLFVGSITAFSDCLKNNQLKMLLTASCDIQLAFFFCNI